MGDKTGIEWTDATWNPVTGCTKVSQGCKNCYAERVSNRFNKEFTKIELHPERLDWPLRWRGSKQAKAEGRPSRIFVNSMSDLFHEEVPDAFIMQVFEVMRKSRHTFQVLTKRPARMLKLMKNPGEPVLTSVRFINFPYVWLGVSVENQETADERIPILLQIPAAVRFVSYEPALGALNLRHIQHNREVEIDSLTGDHGVYRPLSGKSDKKLDWVIAGGESGPHARTAHPDWFRSVRDQCQAAGVPFFFKQWGDWSPNRPGDYGKISRRRYSHESFAWARDGSMYCPLEPPVGHFPSVIVYRLGKKRAGRLLDGREWNELPKEEAR